MVLDVLAQPGQFSIGERRASPALLCRIGANHVEYLEIVHLWGKRATP